MLAAFLSRFGVLVCADLLTAHAGFYAWCFEKMMSPGAFGSG